MKKKIPLVEPYLSQAEYRNVLDCLKTNWISSKGPYVAEFEEKFALYCNRRYAVATSSGTTALHLALIILGIKSGDEVIVPALSFVAVANAVSYTGAKPVFVDVDEKNWNIDPAKIKEKINSKTKAIIVVHLYGHPADMDVILKIAKKHNLLIIEDAAEAHGAEYKNKRVGGFGDISCFSFYGNKIITTGEGGMVLTDNKKWHKKGQMLRDHGMSPNKKYWHPVIGYNYRMTNIQAAIGVAQLQKIDKTIKSKRKIANYYKSLLKDITGIKLAPDETWARSVYWMYSILIEKRYGLTRDRLMERLRKKNIETRPFFYPLHLLPSYKTGKRLKIAESLSKKGINLPSGMRLKREDIKYIADKIKKAAKN